MSRLIIVPVTEPNTAGTFIPTYEYNKATQIRSNKGSLGLLYVTSNIYPKTSKSLNLSTVIQSYIQAFAYPRTFRGSSIHKYLALYVEPYTSTIITDKKKGKLKFFKTITAMERLW